jgi:hypothetical protein
MQAAMELGFDLGQIDRMDKEFKEDDDESTVKDWTFFYIDEAGNVSPYFGNDILPEHQLLIEQAGFNSPEDEAWDFKQDWVVGKKTTAGIIDAYLDGAAASLPPRKNIFGDVASSWEEPDPGIAIIRSEGGTIDDRYLAELTLMAKLAPFGYERAEFELPTWDDKRRVAAWADIMQKAKRLINSGNVTILRNGWNNIVAHVIGDHGQYQCEIGRDDPDSQAITTWQCECPWDQFAWGRTRKWKKYEGRPCAHVLATFWASHSTPLDEPPPEGQATPRGQKDFVPQTPADIPPPPPKGPGAPKPDREKVPAQGEQMRLPMQQQGPVTPPPQQPQQQPQQQPGKPNVLPPFPGEQMQLVPPGQTRPGEAPQGQTVSVPGARPPTPFGPVQQLQTFSKTAKEFKSGQRVRLMTESEMGILQGKSVAHGAGQYKEIPMNSVGEVIGQDPTTGWVDVIFEGPQKDAGPLEPFSVRAWLEPEKLGLLGGRPYQSSSRIVSNSR